MRALILASLAAVSATSFAETLIARQGNDSVQLTEQPCPEQIHAMLPVPPSFFRAALVKFDGQDWIACWRKVRDSAHLIYEDGDQGLIPMSDFKDSPGI